MTRAGDIANLVTRELESRADPLKAPQMQAYMKTRMPFFGVQKAGRVEVMRLVRSQFDIDSPRLYAATLRALWGRRHREEKYLAIAFARHYRRFITPQQLPLYRRMITEGAWWDFVDDIAINLVGLLWRTERKSITPIMDTWIEDEDLWLRRSALIAQLKHTEDTDERRLFRYCRWRAGESEFFIRKAIGWALREHAKTRPQAVRSFLATHGAKLSPLSYREAAKHL